jgi:hypothetical protein
MDLSREAMNVWHGHNINPAVVASLLGASRYRTLPETFGNVLSKSLMRIVRGKQLRHIGAHLNILVDFLVDIASVDAMTHVNHDDISASPIDKSSD